MAHELLNCLEIDSPADPLAGPEVLEIPECDPFQTGVPLGLVENVPTVLDRLQRVQPNDHSRTADDPRHQLEQLRAAAVRASSIVSRSRISPTRMMFGIFTKRASQGGGEGLGVHADFTMVDQRTVTLVDELDRVLHRQDVILSVLVRVIGDGRQGRRFTATCRTSDEYQASMKHRELREDRREA